MSTTLAEYCTSRVVRKFFDNMLGHLRWAERSRLSTLPAMEDESKDVFTNSFTLHIQLKDVICFDSTHSDSI